MHFHPDLPQSRFNLRVEWHVIHSANPFVTPVPHARAAALPLLVLPPQRLRLLNPVQSLQVMLSLQFTRAGHGRRCAALASLMPSADARDAFNVFMLTLLARRVAAGQIADPLAEQHAVEDRWRDPLVNRRWQRLALRLTAEDCERIGRVAAERGLAGSGVRWLAAESATDGWALESSGYVSDSFGEVASATCPPAGPGPAGLGSSRKHGPQGLQRQAQGRSAQRSQAFDQAHAVERAQLIQNDQALLALECERDSKGRRPRAGGHGRDDHSAQMRVHLDGRDDHAGASLADLAAQRRVELCQPDVAGLQGRVPITR